MADLNSCNIVDADSVTVVLVVWLSAEKKTLADGRDAFVVPDANSFVVENLEGLDVLLLIVMAGLS